VVSHDAFAYLGRRYGLRVLGINGISPEAEPSPWHIRQLQDTVRRLGITAIYGEPLDSSSIAASVAHDLGLPTTDLDAIEGLTPATAHDNYLTLMRDNLRTLRKGNQCR
jgi:zinc transport system substrate-binding protein